MANHSLPWQAIHEYLISVGKICDERQFCVQIIEDLRSFIPYDQARIFLVDDNDHVIDAVVFGTNKKWNRLYLDYYFDDKDTKYSFARRNATDGLVGVYDWSVVERDSFITDYIMPQHLKYSLGFGLVDSSDRIKSIFSLDRIEDKRFSQREQSIMQHLHPHLNNLHRMLLYAPPTKRDYLSMLEEDKRLTPREVEIADYLCQGITPTNISKKLHISLQTVYRHSANIHSKLHVSNRQELMLKWMQIRYPKDNPSGRS